MYRQPLTPALEALNRDRLAALQAMSDHDLLITAADIVAKEPFLVNGSFRDVFDQASLSRLGIDVNVDQPVACHCLEGAMREAAGVYYPLEAPHLEGPFVGSLSEVEYAFDRRRRELDKHVVAQFDRAKLDPLLDENAGADYPTPAQLNAGEDYYAPGVVYLYSDSVLAAMGSDGPKEAERILRAAAASIAQEA